MARILHNPAGRHNCYTELDLLDEPNLQPVGVVAECSCSLQYIVCEHQIDGRYWARLPMRSSPPRNAA